MLRFPRSSEPPGEPISPDPRASASRSTSRRARLGRRVWRGLLGLGCGLAVLYGGLNIYASARLNRALERARAQGEPLTMAELVAPAPAAEQNAASLYDQADAALFYSPNAASAVPSAPSRGVSKEEEQMLKLAEPNTPLDAPGLAVLAHNRRAVELVRWASERPKCVFPIDWSQPALKILFPQYGKMRRLARLMSVQAIVEAKRGNTQAALRDARCIFAISDHLKDEPMLMGFLVARAINVLGNRTVAHILEVAPISAERGRAFEASLPKTDWSAWFRRAMLGERAAGLSAFESARAQPSMLGGEVLSMLYSEDAPNSPGTRLLLSPLGKLWAPMLKLDEVELLRLCEMRLRSVTPMSVPMPPGDVEDFEKALRDTPTYALSATIMFPPVVRSRQYRDLIEVYSRQRQVVLALSAYRQAYARYPAKLSQAEAMWGPLPRDLYSSQPMRYTSDGRTFVLYSVGPNGADDGGRNFPTSDRDGTWPKGTEAVLPGDIVWNSPSR